MHAFNNVRMARRYRSQTSGARDAEASVSFHSGKWIASKSYEPDTVTGMGTTPPARPPTAFLGNAKSLTEETKWIAHAPLTVLPPAMQPHPVGQSSKGG